MSTLWDLNRKPRLLFVGDDTDIGNMFKIYFDPTAEVTTAYRAIDGLALYSTNLFDLVILDLGLPDLDEYEFMKSIRASSNKVPVLFLTQKNRPSDKLKGLEIDADDYISKPFDIEELKLRVSGLLRRYARDFAGKPPSFNFSTQELDIIQFLRDGLKVHEIAQKLDTTDAHVDSVIQEIFRKLRLQNRDEFDEWFDNEEEVERVIDRLAGDTTTDAPPPEKKKKTK